MHAVLLVLDDPDKLDELLAAWEEAGVGGATIWESTGLQRVRRRVRGARYAFPFPVLAQGDLEGHYTVLTVVEGEAKVRRCVERAEAVVGALDGPESGMLIAWPLSLALGVTGAGGAGADTEETAGGRADGG